MDDWRPPSIHPSIRPDPDPDPNRAEVPAEEDVGRFCCAFCSDAAEQRETPKALHTESWSSNAVRSGDGLFASDRRRSQVLVLFILTGLVHGGGTVEGPEFSESHPPS
jgi:hypothetical protein